MFFPTSEEIAAAQGLGALFSVFLVALAFMRVGTRSRTQTARKFSFFTAWVLLTVPPTFRLISRSLGHGDSHVYQLQFLSDAGARGQAMSLTGTGGASEPLYLLMIQFLRTFTDNPQVFFFVCYGTIAAGFVYFVAKTVRADNPILPLLLFFPSWLHAFSGLRNWMAIALLLVAMTWYMRKKTWLFYFWATVATSIHFSTAPFLVLPLAAWILFRRRGVAWTVGVLAAMNAAAYASSALLTRFLTGTRYEDYIGAEASNFTFVLPMLVLTLTGVYLVQNSSDFSPNEKLLLTMPIFISGIITIILLHGGYRYVNYALVPLAVIAGWSLTSLRSRFPTDLFARTFWRVGLYLALWVWGISNLRTVMNLSHVFPVVWSQ